MQGEFENNVGDESNSCCGVADIFSRIIVEWTE